MVHHLNLCGRHVEYSMQNPDFRGLNIPGCNVDILAVERALGFGSGDNFGYSLFRNDPYRLVMVDVIRRTF